MKQKSKTISLLALSAVLIAVLLLSGSLSNLDMQLGAPIPESGEQLSSARPIWDPPEATAAVPVIRGFLALVFLSLSMYMAFRFLMLVNLNLILRVAAAAALVLILLVILPRTPPDDAPVGRVNDPGIDSSPSSSYDFAPLGQPPEYLQWVVAGAAGVGLALLAYKLLRFEAPQSDTKEQLSKQAETAIQALRAGQMLENVILRCYQEMSQSLQESQGIERERAMTVGEFEALLTARGFPTDPVQRLSGLFERARYGDLPMRAADEEQAIKSLDAIINFCRSGSEA